MESLLTHEAEVYAFVYFGAIIALSLLESVVPRRAVDDTLRRRSHRPLPSDKQ